jgi:hypothetical protein
MSGLRLVRAVQDRNQTRVREFFPIICDFRPRSCQHLPKPRASLYLYGVEFIRFLSRTTSNRGENPMKTAVLGLLLALNSVSAAIVTPTGAGHGGR